MTGRRTKVAALLLALLGTTSIVVATPQVASAADNYDLHLERLYVEPDAVVPGATITVSPLLTNSGNATTNGPTQVVYTLPAGITFIGGTGCSVIAADQVACAATTPLPGGAASSEGSVQLATDSGGSGVSGAIAVTVTGTDPDPDLVDNSMSQRVGYLTDTAHSADLRLVSTSFATPQVARLSTVAHDVTVINEGTDPALGVTLLPQFSPGLTIVPSPQCTSYCTVGDLAPGASATVHMEVQIPLTAQDAAVYWTAVSATPDINQNNTNGTASFLQPAGAIFGTVRAGSTPIAGATVMVYEPMLTQNFGTVTTDASGNYVVRGLANGNYRVLASVVGSGQRWAPGTQDFMSSTIVSITDSSLQPTGIDVTFPGGTISGTIRVGSAPLVGANVTVSGTPPLPSGGSTVTDANGHYVVGGLQDGAYQVGVSAPGLQHRWYSNQSDGQTPLTVTVDSASPYPTGIDVTYPGGTISGTVTWRGAPLANVFVYGTGPGVMNDVSAMADASGNFTLRGLVDGGYSLRVSSTGTNYTSPSLVNVGPASPNPTGVILDVPPGRVTGTVVRADGQPFSSGFVQLRSASGARYVGSLSGGSFVIGAVPDGTYTLSVTDMGTLGLNVPIDHPTPIVIGPGSYDVDGIAITMPATSTLTGHVNGSSGPVPFVPVTLYSETGNYLTGVGTNASGEYTFTGLPPGRYYVAASNMAPGAGSPEVYYPSAPTRATATLVDVAAGSTVSGVDIVLPRPAGLSGTVVGSDGHPVSGATVYLLEPGVFFPIAFDTTDAAGAYDFPTIAAGRPLTLFVTPPFGSPYLSEWYGDVADFANAASFTLASGEARTLVVELALGASVAGQVTDQSGAPVDGWVTLYNSSQIAQGQIVNGSYQAVAVRPGTYIAYVQPGDPNNGVLSDYAPEYYGETYDQAQATPITVTDGQALSGIDVQLALGGRVEGRVTDPLGQPVSGATVDLGASNAPDGVYSPNRQAGTQSDGTYVVRGVVPGTYAMTVQPEVITGLTSASLTRTVALGQTITGTNAQLARGAVGTATVSDDNGPVVNPMYYTGPIVCPAGSVFTQNYNCGSAPLSTGVQQPSGAGWFVGPLAPGDYWAAGFSFSTGATTGAQAPLSLAPGESFHCDLTLPGVTTRSPSCSTFPATAGATLRGRVTGGSGTGLAGVNVTAEYDVGSNLNIALLTRVTTDSLGYYTMPDVQPGTYRVKFQPPANSPGLSMQWYTADGVTATSAADGDLVTAGDGQTLTGIDVRFVQNGAGTAMLTENGAPAAQSFGRVAAMCHAPAHYEGAFFNCSDNSQALLAFYNASIQRYVWQTIPPGTYNVRAADVFGGPRLGAETSVSIFSGDAIDCTLPLEVAGTATCNVTHTLNDTDGISGTVEDAAPNAGDGNGDGTPDAVQANVTSVADPTIAPGTTQADYITLAIEPASNGGNNYPLAAVSVTDPPPADPAPPGATPQTGLIGFDVVDLPTTGAPVTVTLDLYLGALANSYWKYDQTNGWQDYTSIASFDPTPVSIGGLDRWKVTLTITDNGVGDENPALGVISDPGVFAFVDPDKVAPDIVWNGGITAGQSFDFGMVAPAPTCTAADTGSGPADCTITGYSPAVGTHTLTAVAHDVAGNETVETRSYTVTPYTLRGFQKPVDMGGVWNTMKPGKTVSFRFEIFRGATELTSVAAVQSFRYTTVSCSSGTALEDPVEIVSAEDDGLEYETGPGQFRLKWKTPNRTACLKAVLTTVDGSTLSALFKLK